MTRIAAAAGLLVALIAQDGAAPAAAISSETPVWSPDGTRLAFSAGPAFEHQIYVIDADGRNATQLTSGEQNRWPAWSPDGKTIVFMSDRDGQGELYAMNPDGTNQRRLTSTPAHEFAPAWSPRGDTIGFLVEMPESKQQLGKINPDGTGLARIDGDHLYYGRPAWRPDATVMLVAANREAGTRASDRWNLKVRIYAYAIDGSEPAAITADGYDTNPWPSPDGTRLVVDTGDGTSWASGLGQWKLWVLNLTDGTRRQLTAGETNDWGASWSPDGTRIAFSGGRDRVYRLQIVEADGSGLRSLTRTDPLPDAM